jgi:hypothetical protein
VICAARIELDAAFTYPARLDLNPRWIAERPRQRDEVERKPVPEGQQHGNIGGYEGGQDGRFGCISSIDRVHVRDGKGALGQNTCSRPGALALTLTPRP